MIDLAETLGLTAVAEGVENVETARALASYGCTVAQGYFCGRPLPIAELLEYLAEPADPPVWLIASGDPLMTVGEWDLTHASSFRTSRSREGWPPTASARAP